MCITYRFWMPLLPYLFCKHFLSFSIFKYFSNECLELTSRVVATVACIVTGTGGTVGCGTGIFSSAIALFVQTVAKRRTATLKVFICNCKKKAITTRKEGSGKDASLISHFLLLHYCYAFLCLVSIPVFKIAELHKIIRLY